VELTAAGTAFLPHARASLTAAYGAAAAVAATERAAGGRLPLSINGDALEYTREFLQAFAAAHPEVHIDVTLKFQDESKEALARHDVDASILWSGDEPPPGFADTSALVAAPGAGIALRASHPLARLPEVALDRLEGQRLIMFPRERAADLYDLILDGLGGAARFSSIYHITTIGQSVSADMLGALDDESVTPSPEWCNLPQTPTGFIYKPVVPAVAATLWLVWAGVPTGPTGALAAFAEHATPTRAPSLREA
jgi:DNA-binding transcriptional LysR family regulator